MKFWEAIIYGFHAAELPVYFWEAKIKVGRRSYTKEKQIKA